MNKKRLISVVKTVGWTLAAFFYIGRCYCCAYYADRNLMTLLNPEKENED